MKKPKKLNKFLAGAGAVFAILLAWSVKTVYTPPRLLEAEDAGSPRTTKWGSVLLPPEPTWDLGRIRGSNFFPKPSTPRRGASASDPPADEKNQFQAITGATYSTNAIKNLMNGASEYGRQIIEKQ